MATKKTILSIEVTKDEYHVSYSGGFRPDWDHLSKTKRREVLRHDGRIVGTFLACPQAFKRIAGLVHATERCLRREAKKKTKCIADDQVKTSN